jgi:hypothetical protein
MRAYEITAGNDFQHYSNQITRTFFVFGECIEDAMVHAGEAVQTLIEALRKQHMETGDFRVRSVEEKCTVTAKGNIGFEHLPDPDRWALEMAKLIKGAAD